MQLLYRLSIIVVMAFCAAAQAQDNQPLGPANERYIELLANGGPASIRDAAKGMHRTQVSDERVLDVAAEVLLRDYKSADSASEIDALAWVANALSNAKTNRYQDVLIEVQKNASHRKLAGYAKKNRNKRLPVGEPFQVGTVSLEKVAAATAKPAEKPAAKPVAQAPTSGEYHPISVVKPGMSMQEAFDLAGPPTATHQHQTGKAFIPFNYKGGDLVRQQALYKGQGRIVLSNSSRYTNSWEVLEVVLDETESGYP